MTVYDRWSYGWSYGWRSSRASDALAEEAVGGLLLLAVVLLLLVAYGLVRGVSLVVRVLRQHPHHHGLHIALASCLGSWGLAGLAAALTSVASNPRLLIILTVMAGIATVALLITAKLVDLDGQDLFQRERTKETLLEDVLHRPWWKADADAA